MARSSGVAPSCAHEAGMVGHPVLTQQRETAAPQTHVALCVHV
jgi:hypothetical protein